MGASLSGDRFALSFANGSLPGLPLFIPPMGETLFRAPIHASIANETLFPVRFDASI
jgi:hypothetical protein